MARPLFCARCDKIRIGKERGRQLCDHCRLLALHYIFNADIDKIRLQQALEATKKWQPASESRCWQVVFSRTKRGEQPDAWLVDTYRIFGVQIPDVQPTRPNACIAPFLRKRGEPGPQLPVDATRLIANAKLRAKLRTQRLQANQCPEPED
jgi:hypothetical protein